MEEELFVLMASAILKVPQLQNTRLYDKLKECLTETGAGLDKKNEKQSNPNLLLVKNLKLLVELYSFLPGKKATAADAGQQTNVFNFSEGRGGRNQSGGGALFNTI